MVGKSGLRLDGLTRFAIYCYLNHFGNVSLATRT
ncbi:hypothetical protein MHA_1411 [Mannheimia haemolytica PHL213]|nr:hypothetical protein MHA_1411 [Mannheimia haemolytica PHL213]